MAEYTVRQASDMSGMSERHIWRLIAKGTLIHRRDDAEGRVWIASESLADLVKKRERAAPPGPRAANRELLQRVEQLERRVTELEHARSVPWARVAEERQPRLAANPGPVSQHPVGGRTGDLPQDLIGIQELANAHQIPPTTVIGAVDRGDLPVVQGTWSRGRGRFTRAIDAEGRRAFYVLFQDHPRFQACADCPH